AAELLGYFHAGGGAENMRRLLARIAGYLEAWPSSVSASPSHLLPRGEKDEAGPVAPFSPRGRRCRQADEGPLDAADLTPTLLPPFFALGKGGTPLPWREALAALHASRPLVPILLYRSGVAAGDMAMGEAVASALAAKGFAPLPLALTSLKDRVVAAELAALIATRKPAL
ncbi:MAG: hypothetical protein QHC89_30295, partial [Bosea sp. (in: a-proteobacteria)]|nr:hypothetical protein [Bosea sp. (in: a-proteobacteria)]